MGLDESSSMGYGGSYELPRTMPKTAAPIALRTPEVDLEVRLATTKAGISGYCPHRNDDLEVVVDGLRTRAPALANDLGIFQHTSGDK